MIRAHLSQSRPDRREQDTLRLRETAHKLRVMMAAFSTVAGGVAAELEENAARDWLEESRPLVEQLGTMGKELMRLAGELSIETLRQAGEFADGANPTAGP
jgi:hypothetical protein